MNEFERNRYISNCLSQWRERDACGDCEQLVNFVLDQPNLSDEDRRLLALATIADVYRVLYSLEEDVSIEQQAEAYLAAFEGRSFPLVRTELLKRLAEVELENSSVDESAKEEYKKRFPEIADFFDEYFERCRTQIYTSARNMSRTRSTFADGSSVPPKTISLTERYDVEKLIGKGGQKNVYLAKQESASQSVALKILRAGINTYANELNRDAMKSEVFLQARLSHPNIPQILSFDGDGDSPTLVERLIPNGTTWSDIINQKTLEENLAILTTVAQIVAYAHEREHIIHRDLKPSNVMLGESGGRFNEVYLVDWGLALSLDDPDLAEKRPGGTTVYMPPESAEGNASALSFATDVFTLGGILFHILTGKAPYEDVYVTGGGSEANRAAKEAQVPPIPKINPVSGIINPPELIEIATKALQKKPDARYEDGSAFVDALERYRRRANLRERLHRADEAFAQLRETSENASTSSISPTTLIETANEFRLIREEAADSDAKGEPSRLFQNAVESERAARELLVETSLQSGDFTLVASQIDAVDALNRITESSSNDAKVAEYRLRLHKGIVTRKRERLAKWGVLTLVGVVLLGVFLGYDLQKDKKIAQEQAKVAEANQAVAQEQAKVEKANATAAQSAKELAQTQAKMSSRIALEQSIVPVTAEHWAQGELALYDAANDLEYTASKMNIAEHSGIFLEETSSVRREIEDVVFSTDDKYLAILTDEYTVHIFKIGNPDACSENEEFIKIASETFEKRDGCCWLYANPFFRNENADNPIQASRFIVCSDNYLDYYFLQFNEKGKVFETPINFHPDELKIPEEMKAKVATERLDSWYKEKIEQRKLWNKPRFFTTSNGDQRCVVCAMSGEGFIFSLSDGKLLKRFQPQDSEDDSPYWTELVVEDNGETFFSAGTDGLIKRWTTDGEFIETLDLEAPGRILTYMYNHTNYLSLSPDGKRLLVSEGSTFVIWEVYAKQIIYKGENYNNPEKSRFNAYYEGIYWLDNERFVTFEDDALVWNLSKRDSNNELLHIQLRDPKENPIYGFTICAVSPSRRLIAYSSYASTLKGTPLPYYQKLEIYDSNKVKKIAESEGLQYSTVEIAEYVSKYDRILVGTSEGASILSLDPGTLRVETIFQPCIGGLLPYKEAQVESFAIPEIGDEFAAALSTEDICFFKNGTSEPIAEIEAPFHNGDSEKTHKKLSPTSIAVSPDGSLLLAKNDNELVLWNWKTRSEIRRWKDSSKIPLGEDPSSKSGLVFINNSEAIEIREWGKIVRWNVDTGKCVSNFIPSHPRLDLDFLSYVNVDAHCLCFRLSNDRKRLALGYYDGLVKIIDVVTGNTHTESYLASNFPQQEKKMQKHESPYIFSSNQIKSLTWAHNDNFLCVGLSSGKIILTHTLKLVPATIFVAADIKFNVDNSLIPFFTRDGKLITVDSYGFLKRWDFRLSPEKEKIFFSLLDLQDPDSHILWRFELTSRPNIWYGFFQGVDPDEYFALFDGNRELWRREDLIDLQELSQPGSKKETFLGLDKTGVLSAFDETGNDVQLDFDLNLNAPEYGGFCRVYSSPDRQTLAGISNVGELYLLTNSDKSEGWHYVTDMVKPDDLFVFRSDSKELAIVDKSVIKLVPVEKNKNIRYITLNPTIEFNNLDEITYSTSGKFLFLIHNNSLLILNLEKLDTISQYNISNIEQLIKIDVCTKIGISDYICSIMTLDLGLDSQAEKSDAFVLATQDGTLHFYRFNKSQSRFEPVYRLSRKTLVDIQGEHQDVRLTDGNFIAFRLNNDQKILYLASLSGIFSFDMDEIRRNIAGLPEYWRNMNVERITGLRSTPQGLRFVEHERLLPVVKK